MPTHKQGTVNSNATVKALGTADSETVKACFPANPVGVEYALHDNGTNDADIRKNFSELCLEGVVNDAGHTFGEFNLDFADAPDIAEVETGGGGLPGSPWTPNPSSSPTGNPADQPDPPSGWGEEPSDPPGAGVGSGLGPRDSSAQQASVTLGDYGFGKSPYQT